MENRTLHFDSDLRIEAYHFEGIMQKFPNHFHEHYVIGFVESGRRFLICKNREYTVEAGDLLLFNPLDSHACERIDGRTLDWRLFKNFIGLTPKRYQSLFGDADGDGGRA